MRKDRDARSNSLDVGDDVGRENDDTLAGKLGEEIAEADALFRVEAGSGLVDDEELWVVEKSLRDSDALAHAP